MISEDTLISRLELNVERRPNKVVFKYIENNINLPKTVTFKELNDKVKIIASRLQESYNKGDRALLLYPSNLDFIYTFLGCLYAGIIPVPAYPPRKNQNIGRLKAIIEDCDAKVILTTNKIYKISKNIFENDEILSSIQLFSTEDIKSDKPFKKVLFRNIDLAFLQYTSGSTGNPKGVMVTHENILSNLEVLQKFIECDEDTIGASWLPYFHDMGLIGGVLLPIYVGFEAILMSPLYFLQKPIRWLEVISNYNVNVTSGPNFSYELCINIKESDLDNINLSSLDSMLNGAEPISASTLKRFTKKFLKYGFNPIAHCPCYGMAEATLIITGIPRGKEYRVLSIDSKAFKNNKILFREKDEKTQELVSCGVVRLNHECIIVNNDIKLFDENQIGEIFIKGTSITRGYWNNPKKTEDDFKCFIDKDDSVYFKTGDLGFLHDNELYVCGRIKDLIIVRGRNFYPQDIEFSSYSSHEALVDMGAVAFSIKDDGIEKLIIVQEIKRTFLRKGNMEELFEVIRESIAYEHELQLYDIVLLKPGQLFKTSSGKMQRSKTKEAYLRDELVENRIIGKKVKEQIIDEAVNIMDIEDFLVKKISLIVNIPIYMIDMNKPFNSFGIDSLNSITFINDLNEILNTSFPVTIFYEYPTIKMLSSFIRNNKEEESLISQNKFKSNSDIAIIGVSCNFAGAQTLNEYWDFLSQGKSSISYFDEKRKFQHNTERILGGYLHDIDLFDPDFFHISYKEAKVIDPQHRMLMQISYNTLRNAGYSYRSISNTDTGVFIGISQAQYSELCIKSSERMNPYIPSGNSLSNASNRLSYIYNITGPSMSIDTACSSSLVALHQAINSIHLGDCSIALVGGVSLILDSRTSIALKSAQMLATDGLCKTFDDAADGYSRGEGAGMIMIKSLAQAENDGDYIHGVIKGSAVVQDGLTSGFSAPSETAQGQTIKKALASANIHAKDVSYVETHGTGTKLGDPIEISALNKIYGQEHTDNNTNFYVGSVKANIGHLEPAAGIASLIKGLVLLDKKMISPQINLIKRNTLIPFSDIPIRIVTKLTPWKVTEGKKYIMGISSFGFGGTNSHVILQEYEKPIKNKDDNKYSLFYISIKHKKSLLETKKILLDYISAYRDEVTLEELCYNLWKIDENFDNKIAFVVKNMDELEKKISLLDKVDLVMPKKNLCMLFSGQGSQYTGMGRELYEDVEFFKTCIDECNKIVQDYVGVTLYDILWQEDKEYLSETLYTQLALFSIESSLGRYYRFLGIVPDILLGHSLGEYAAAYMSGVFTLEDAFKLIYGRAILVKKLVSPADMISVMEEEDVINHYISGKKSVNISVYNGHKNLVLSGSKREIDNLENEFTSNGIQTKRLNISSAFHSKFMDIILEPFLKIAKSISYNTPKIKIVSSISGQIINDKVMDPNYWVKHIRDSVQFKSCIKTVESLMCRDYIEVGPGRTLLALVNTEAKEKTTLLSSLRENKNDTKEILKSIESLIKLNHKIDFEQFFTGKDIRGIPLPVYAFNQKTCWVDYNRDSVNYRNEDMNYSDIEVKNIIHIKDYIELGNSESDEFINFNWIIYGKDKHLNSILEKKLNEKKLLIFILNDKNELKKVLLSSKKNIKILITDFINASDTAQVLTDATSLVQLFLSLELLVDIKLWFITKQAMTINREDKIGCIASSSLFGFLRTLQIENKSIFGGLIDFKSEKDAELILENTLYYDKDKFIVIRNLKRYGVRLVSVDYTKEKKEIEYCGSVIITGGKGALGIQTMKWLAGKGIKSFYLLGRDSKLSVRAKEEIDKLKLESITVHLVEIDVTNYVNLENLFKDIQYSGDSINYIYHLAGREEASLIENQALGNINDLIKAKVSGAYNLHHLSMSMGLELKSFVLYSSTSAIFGNYGQAIYAASNAYLDGLSKLRRDKGLTALSVNWGPWEGDGFANSVEVKKYLTQIGIVFLDVFYAFDALNIALEYDKTNVSINHCDWETFNSYYQLNSNDSFLDGLVETVFVEKKWNLLEGKNNKEQYLVLQEILIDEIMKITEVDRDNISLDKNLIEYGLDSLMIVQFQNKLKVYFSIRIPLKLFFESPTIRQLTKEILQIIVSGKNDLQEDEIRANKRKMPKSMDSLNEVEI